jgi:2-oxoglutarate dehydrogenase E2 component (dihydrolipoamide succinyltransferase)
MSVNIVVPEVGESIVDARVAKWLRKQGDHVAAGDPLVELETDKIDLEVAAPQAGVLGRIDHQDGADVKVGDVLGIIDEGAGAGPEGAGASAEGAGAEAEGTDATAEGAGAAAEGGRADAERARAGAGGPGKTRATPAARKAAQQNAVDLTSVKGSGDAGRVMRRDVEQVTPRDGRSAEQQVPAAEMPGSSGRLQPAREQPAAQPRPAPAPVTPRRAPGERTEERIRMSKRRATIARRLIEAQSTAAMLTTFNEVDMSAVQALRARHKESFKERHGVSLGMTSFFVKATIGALRAFPRINAEVQGDEMVLKQYYDIGIAVGASEGLVVPVLRDADQMSFAEIEAQTREVAKKAADGSLSLADIRGGTFTITNGGVFGSLQSTPILNPPQVGILGLHAIKERPVGVNGQIVLRPMMYTALTYDHRIVDGAEAVRFLVRVKELIEDPGALLIE